jgi:hypothetical protein
MTLIDKQNANSMNDPSFQAQFSTAYYSSYAYPPIPSDQATFSAPSKQMGQYHAEETNNFSEFIFDDDNDDEDAGMKQPQEYQKDENMLGKNHSDDTLQQFESTSSLVQQLQNHSASTMLPESLSLPNSHLVNSMDNLPFTPQDIHPMMGLSGVVGQNSYGFDSSLLYPSQLQSNDIFQYTSMGINFAAPAAGPAYPTSNFLVPASPVREDPVIYETYVPFSASDKTRTNRTAAQSTNIAGGDDVDKKTLKRLRNRVSASRCRFKKKCWIQDMEERHHLLKQEHDGLLGRVNMLKEAVMYSKMIYQDK